MKAVILAAGKGERFFPFSYYRPKPLFPVCNKPIIQHQLERLVELGVKDIIVVIGHRGDRLKNYLGSGEKFNCNIKYVYQKNLLGTADAIIKASNYIDDDFILLYGDVIFAKGVLKQLIEEWNKIRNADALIVLKEVEEPWKHVTVHVEDSKVKKFYWKARIGHYPSNMAYMGIGVFKSKVIRYFERASGIIQCVENGVIPPEEYDVIDSLNLLIKEGGDVRGFKTDDWIVDIDYPWQVFDANKFMFNEMNKELDKSFIHPTAKIAERVYIKGKVYIDAYCEIEEGVHIKGPAWIGRGTRILSGTYIYGPTIIGENCIIGPYAEVSGCIANEVRIGHCAEVSGVVLEYTWIVHYCHICGIIGERVDIGAGTIVGTLRFDDESAKVIVRGIPKDTKWKGNCAFIGDYARTGVGAMIMPGRIVGPGSMVGPGVIVMKNIPPFKLVLRKEEYEIRDWNPKIYDK